MHMVIRVLVYDKDKKSAFSKATQTLDRLCGEDGQPFDYFTTFDDKTSTVSGEARWGKLPSVCEADSKEGKKLIEEGMEYTKNTFLENIKIARKVLKKKTDNEIFNDDIFDRDMIRYRFYCLGEYRGPSIWLYDNDGEGVRTPKHLKDILNKWECIYEKEKKPNPYKDLTLYVVPADVHY